MRGIVFHAVRSRKYFDMACQAARSAKRVMPSMDTILLTDLDGSSSHVDRIVKVPTPPAVAALMPPLLAVPDAYTSFIYLDADTFVCASLEDVFELVEDDRTDIALVHTSGKRYVDHRFPCPEIPEAFPCYRSGLVALRWNLITKAFVKDWMTYCEQQEEVHGQWHDQPALRKALYYSQLRIAALPTRYCCTCGDAFARNAIRVVHTKGSWRRLKKLAAAANQHPNEPRFFVNGKVILARDLT